MRKKIVRKRTFTPDPRFQSVLVGRFINYVMRKGKKTTAQQIVYRAFTIIQEETKQEPLAVFELAMRNVTPEVEVRSKRVGGANYQIPIEVRGERKIALAFRWMLTAARARHGAPMAKKLAEELQLAAKSEGNAVKKRQDMQRMAEANKAFSHLR
jgi:small subunit ribosomal protein S7